jgi:hypothetical protein
MAKKKPLNSGVGKANDDKGAAKNPGKPHAVSTPGPWTFPRNSIEESIMIPRAIDEKFAGKEASADQLVKAVGFNKSDDWRFQNLLHSSGLYGFTSGTGAKASVKMESIGQDIVAPTDPNQRRLAIKRAFDNVPSFKAVAGFYGSKPIPEDEFFIHKITRDFEIPRDRADKFGEVFRRNIAFMREFSTADVSQEEAPRKDQVSEHDEGTKFIAQERPKAISRKSLDTCFVMMPFGTWFDRYYKEIYQPAISSADYDPKRADELFSSGSVVEQIWEEIRKASVLLADLSNRNANVFYELGLAHAIGKPVVFTAGNIDDVPFDLRHLRVIVYDVREPNWSEKLREAITDYLRSARKEPDKSIPHPFRRTHAEGNQEEA